MTRAQYAAYEERFATFMEREGINCLATDNNSEPFFSWSPCDCCNSTLGGNRETAHGYHPETNKVYSYDICVDCVYYSAYGQLDDMTMMEITDNAA